MQYYIHDGEEKQGPFSLEELKARTISKNTSVWHEGLQDWTKAGSLEELKSIFASVPPPFKKTENKHEAAEQPKSKSLALVFFGIVIVLVLGAVATNPGEKEHRSAAAGALTERLHEVSEQINPKKKFWRVLKDFTVAMSNGLLQEQILKRVSSEDYFVCSLTKVRLNTREAIVGVGAFGKVWLFTDVVKGVGPEELVE